MPRRKLGKGKGEGKGEGEGKGKGEGEREGYTESLKRGEKHCRICPR